MLKIHILILCVVFVFFPFAGVEAVTENLTQKSLDRQKEKHSELPAGFARSVVAELEKVPSLSPLMSPEVSEDTDGRAPANRRKKVKKFGIRKRSTAVPKARQTIKKIRRQAIKVAEPPREFRRYFEVGTDEAELDSVINQEINQLFKLLKTSKRRDLRLRLGSLYIEKARLIEYRLYEKYDQQMTRFQNKQRKSKPRLSLKPTYVYINKSIKLFETYRRQFPKDRNMDQVLFFLGVSYFKRGQLEKGRIRYETLIKKYPKSDYVNDVNFELGEYHFNKSNWKKATDYYRKIASSRQQRLYSFALYKVAWCRLKMGQEGRALANLEAVIREGARQKARKQKGAGSAGRLYFANEALGDLALFYSHSRKKPDMALSYFRKMSGNSGKALKILKELAYIYLDRGNLKGVRIAFKKLIEEEPFSPQAYDYQYQIIRAYTYAGSRQIFLKELKHWIVRYGPMSAWAREHQNNPKLVSKVINLIEDTVRNYTLRMHQSYRKTKDKTAKGQALFSYELYSNHFRKSKLADEMRFFYAELLFDLRQYKRAARQYLFVVENFPKSKHYETASLNSVLTFQKTLPSSKAIEKLVGKKTSFIPFPPAIQGFQKVAHSYATRFPKKLNVPAILYKVASLHYEFNHYKQAVVQFWNLIQKYPNSRYTEYSANLILDIYNLKKDFLGLRQAAIRLLKNKVIANSGSAREIRKILSQVSLKTAEDLAKNKEYFRSAVMYKSFADTHPKSPLRGTAYYNSAINFKKSGDVLQTLSLYKKVLQTPSSSKRIRKTILRDVPGLYQKTGQYMRAADAFSNYARSFPKDRTSVDFWFNSALIYDGFNRYGSAEQAYLEYFKRSKKAEKVQALFLLADLNKRRGRADQAVSYYNQFLNRGSSDKKALVSAAFKIAEIKKAQKKVAQSKTWYRRTIALYKQSKAGVFYAAQAKFHLVHDTYVDFVKIRIPANPKRQQAVVQKKLNLFNKLKEDLKQVIRFDSGYQVVASLVLIGLASEHIGDAIYNSPLPKGLNDMEIKQYKAGLKKTALPFKQEAVKNYKLAVNRARKLSAYNEKWLKKSVERLSILEEKSSIAVNPLLKKEVLPVVLFDWSGV